MKIRFLGHRFNFDMTQFKMLLTFFVQYIIDPLSFRKLNDSVVMYGGHGLTGNLKGFFDFSIENELGYKVRYLSFDKQEYDKLSVKYNERIIYALSFSGMRSVLRSKILMTSHGPGLFYVLKWLKPKIKFVDVWHGIGFKFMPKIYWRVYDFYSGMFVSSEYVKNELYNKVYGISSDKLFVTGYARTDRFKDSKIIAEKVKSELNIEKDKKVIMYAPTYRPFEDDKNSEIPFEIGYEVFFRALNEFCEKTNSTLIFRPHPGSLFKEFDLELSNVRFIPQGVYADTNDLLTIVDLLITDWSSIAVDLYALSKPAIFVEMPGPSSCKGQKSWIERTGDHANNIDELKKTIEKNIVLSEEQVEILLSYTIDKFYGNTLDWKCCERYNKIIQQLLFKSVN